MKGSELIKAIQELIDKHGDLDMVFDDYGDYDIDNVFYVESADEAGERIGPYYHEDPVFRIG